MKYSVIELGGWLGMVCVLAAFSMVSFSFIAPTSVTYQVLNAVGSTGICLDAFHHRDRPAATLNLIFLGISLVALVRNIL